MKLLILVTALLVSGCSTVVPVTQRWPEPPGLQSLQPCLELKKLEESATLSGVATTVTGNYTEYYQCAVKLAAWQEWYAKQQIIHQGLR
jgi:hypothetical protein